jgi:hypothetical protein
MGEGAGLAHQPVDDVPIIDAVLVAAVQARQALDAALGVPHFEVLGIDPDIDALAAEPAVHRIAVVAHANQAVLGYRHRHALTTLLTPCRQRPQQRPFLVEALVPARVPSSPHLLQEGQVLHSIGEIASAPQQQRLLDCFLEVPVRRFHVAVLVARGRVRLLHHQTIVIH